MFEGSIVAIVTPMKSDLSIDWDSFEKLIEFHIESGTNAIVVIGTTGESPTVTPSEHIKCFDFAVKVAKSRIPIIGGSGANSTEEAIYLTKEAEKAGCKAYLSVVPYYNKPTQKGLIAHFNAIADCSELPMILYNVQSRTACDLTVDTVVELSKNPKIIGIKEASSMQRLRELLAACPKDFAIFTGEDNTACQIINEGAAGVISVTANVAPKLMSEMTKLAKTDLESAKIIDEKLSGLHENLFIESNPIPVKWCLYKMGFAENSIRLPLTTLSDDKQQKVLSAMEKAQIVI